ncbi:hypothetical protein N8I74_16530 [Chitiniphilus purpureus]|uniref:Uncharacterized protein n=1 Tax=Chitiniphilus purpureus TaxID=2981137 RepID=A0ABY6DKL4_9NEIS|nr:hypothetical protein [Chitiniphilus sp. CD1]UXY14905.1 hypothetical protein N8I74_16530 [Chitiniphilus sp. CD1]
MLPLDIPNFTLIPPTRPGDVPRCVIVPLSSEDEEQNPEPAPTLH